MADYKLGGGGPSAIFLVNFSFVMYVYIYLKVTYKKIAKGWHHRKGKFRYENKVKVRPLPQLTRWVSCTGMLTHLDP